MKTIRDGLRKNGLGQVDVETIENVQGKPTSFSDKENNFCFVTAPPFFSYPPRYPRFSVVERLRPEPKGLRLDSSRVPRMYSLSCSRGETITRPSSCHCVVAGCFFIPLLTHGVIWADQKK